MILIIVFTMLLLGISFFQAIQGLFSAMIMLVLTVLSAANAVNFSEPLGNLLVDKMGSYTYAVTLMVLFVAPLLTLRTLFDWKLGGNVVLGNIPDRVGGAVFGLLSGLVMVGMLSIIMQLLPFGSSVLGYHPYDSQLQDDDGATPKWAANFTLGLMKTFSANSLQSLGDEPVRYEQVHKDLLREAYALRNRPDGGSASAAPESATLAEAYTLSEEGAEKFAGDEVGRAKILDEAPNYPLTDKSKSTKVYVLRVAVGEGAQDEDKWLRMPATHFRLVTQDGSDYYPVAYLTYAGGWFVNSAVAEGKVAKVGDIVVTRPVSGGKSGKKILVDWVYRLPDNEKPAYLAFRNTVKASVPTIVSGLPAALDPKGGLLALGLKPAMKLVNFPVDKSRFFMPESMEYSRQLSGGLSVPYSAKRQIPEVRDVVPEGPNQFKKAFVDGTLSEIQKMGTDAQWLREFFTPSDTALLQVRFRLNSSGSMDDFKAKLAQMKPQIFLSNGQARGCQGVMFLTAMGEKSLFIYYDADQAATPQVINPEIVEGIMKGMSTNPTIMLLFIVPMKEDLAVSYVSMGLGKAYEYLPDSPLACHE